MRQAWFCEGGDFCDFSERGSGRRGGGEAGRRGGGEAGRVGDGEAGRRGGGERESGRKGERGKGTGYKKSTNFAVDAF